MKIIKTGTRQWENKHETFIESIKDMYVVGNENAMSALEGYNDATKGFQSLIRNAIDTNTPLRTLGAGWSWMHIATATNGIMLDTKQLNTTLRVSSQGVSSDYTGDPNKLLFAQCGNGVWELSRELRGRKLSLKASGASNGQTIAGVLATGAHGSAFDFGAVQEFVVGLHIIVGPDKHIFLERRSAPVVSESFIRNLDTELIRDDDLFDAALVSVGAFGIIHGVLIETEDLYLLECYMRRMPYNDSLKRLMTTLDFTDSELPFGSERPYHFAVSLNPYDMDGGAYVYSFYKRPYHEDYVRHVNPDPNGLGPGDDGPCFIGKIVHVLPDLVPMVVNKALAGALKPYEKVFGTLGEIFNNTTLHGKLLSAAIGVSIEDVNRVADMLLETNQEKGPFLGLFAFRFVKQTKATLGFTRFDHTCVFELDGAFSSDTSNFFREVWKRLDEENISYTTHWGKVNELDFDKINKMYGSSNVDAWIEARNKLLDADTMKVFTNPLMKQWGLDKVLV
ncbi:hypothetical protein BH10BAC3_BH10BAC3_39410 [soil metagenome]